MPRGGEGGLQHLAQRRWRRQQRGPPRARLPVPPCSSVDRGPSRRRAAPRWPMSQTTVRAPSHKSERRVNSVRPMAAFASGPSRPAKKISTRTKTDSSAIGAARRISARRTGPCVRSCSVPVNASLKVAQKPWRVSSSAGSRDIRASSRAAQASVRFVSKRAASPCPPAGCTMPRMDTPPLA